MGPGQYESLKRLILAAAPLTRDGWHVAIGAILVLIFALWAVAIRRPYPAWPVIIVALGLAWGLEAIDVIEDMVRFGQPHLLDTLWDVLLTGLAPVLALVAVRSGGGPDGLWGWVLGRHAQSGAAGFVALWWAAQAPRRAWVADRARRLSAWVTRRFGADTPRV